MGRKRCKLSPVEYEEKACKGGDFICKKCNRIANKVKRLCKPLTNQPKKDNRCLMQ